MAIPKSKRERTLAAGKFAGDLIYVRRFQMPNTVLSGYMRIVRKGVKIGPRSGTVARKALLVAEKKCNNNK